MVDEDKLKELKDRIETAKSLNTPNIKKNKESGAGFGFKISTEIIAALVVGVGIGLIVDKYLGTKPFGLISAKCDIILNSYINNLKALLT